MTTYRLTETSTIKAAELVVGQVYVAKDGRMLLYIGRDVKRLYVFYFIGIMALRESSYEPGVPQHGRWLTAVNEAYLMPYYRSMLADAMGSTPNWKCITKLSNMPNLVGTIYQYSLDSIREFFSRTYEKWGAELVKIAELNYGAKGLHKKEVTKEYTPVKASELIPGKIYICGRVTDIGTRYEGYRATYVYLGKVNGGYTWLCIDWLEDVKDCEKQLRERIELYSRHYGNVERTSGEKIVYEPVFYKVARKLQLSESEVAAIVRRCV